MGNFNRREPVRVPIPRATGFLYSGIDSFKGLHITDNPFVADKGSASEILNLYIDETNKLVTRPRLDFGYDINSTELGHIMTTILDVAYLDTFTLHLGIKDGETVLYARIHSSGEVKKITPLTDYSLSTEKLKVFKKDGITYLFDGLVKDGKYYYSHIYTSDNVFKIRPVADFYVPTTHIGRTSLVPGEKFEELNSLTNKYRTSWRWDGVWGIIDDGTTHTIDGKGVFVSQTILDKTQEATTYTADSIFKVCSKGIVTRTGNVFTCYDLSQNVVKTYDLDDIYGYNTTSATIDISDDFQTIAWYFKRWGYIGGGEYIQPDVYVYRDGVTSHYDYENFIAASEDRTQQDNFTLKLSNDGSALVFSYDHFSIDSGDSLFKLTVQTVLRGILNETNSTYTFTKFEKYTPPFSIKDWYFSPSGETVVYRMNWVENPTSGVYVTYGDLPKLGYVVDFKTMVSFAPNENSALSGGVPLAIDYNGIDVVYSTATSTYICRNIVTSINPESFNTSHFTTLSNLKLDEDTLWGITNGQYLIYISNLSTTPIISKFKINSTISSPYNKINSLGYYVLLQTGISSYKKYFLDINNPLQEVIYENTVDDTHPDYQNWYKLHNTNCFCTLFTNFMNNYWVARDKILRSSENNNPFYFPIYKYNEFNEDITGMNRLGDNLLAVYSEKSIYLQQPIYQDDGSYVMTSTETKSVKGNIALGQTIVTSHTSVPVQMARDGIYALQLEENVQSSERITVLMTEKINKLLLKEVMEDCMTFNFRYYTYFIFPNNINTHIYVLDTRNNEWFYWEIPVTLVAIFDKEGIVYVCDKDGLVYRLEKEEEVADTGSDSSPTIYADEIGSDNTTIIPWKWVSQILHLSNINNYKQLYTTSFIMLDNDDFKDSYGLTYKFKAFKKYDPSETNAMLASGDITYIKTVTKRTYLSAFNFIKLELTNPYDDSNVNFDGRDANKLSLVSIVFKYKLLPGGM